MKEGLINKFFVLKGRSGRQEYIIHTLTFLVCSYCFLYTVSFSDKVFFDLRLFTFASYIAIIFICFTHFFVLFQFSLWILYLCYQEYYNDNISWVYFTFVNLYFFVLLIYFVQSFFLVNRRLRDLNFSGWWQIIGIIPFCQFFMSLVLIVFKGTPTTNKYGEPPID